MLRNIALGTGLLFVLPSVMTSCEKDLLEPDINNENPLIIDLTDPKYSNLVSTGGSLIEALVIIINTGTGFIALSSICTHRGCTVSFNARNDTLPCPCHGSLCNLNGAVLKGPSISPLKKFSISQEGDVLTIT